MKIRSKIFRKRIIFLSLATMSLTISISALASSTNTTLLTTVPSHFVIDVTIVGNGRVIINETEITQSTQSLIERHKAVGIRLLPGDNNRVDSVIYNGTSVVAKVNNGEILLPTLEKNAELKVTFVVDSATPDTGDTSFLDVIYLSIIAIISLSAIILIAVKRICYKK